MGLDLTLAPISYPRMKWWLATTRISLDRNYEIFDQLPGGGRDSVLNATPIPPDVKFDWYGRTAARQRDG